MCVWDALYIDRAATSEMRWQLSFVLASEKFSASSRIYDKI